MEPLFWPSSTGQLPVRNLRRRLKHGQLFWREVGRGQTVIFLHGSWSDGDQWSDVLSLMGQTYHCLAPDLVGFGESGRLQEQTAYSIAMQVNTLAEWLSSLRLTSVVFVGHSLGAWVAASYALRYPDQVKGLCVLEPEGVSYAPQRWRRERWLVTPLAGLWLAITKPFAHRPTPGRTSPWWQNYHLRQRLRRHPVACRLLFERRRKALEPEIIGNQLAALSMPVVILQGDTAGESSRQLTQSFTMAAPNARVKLLPGDDQLPSGATQAVAEFLYHWISR